MPQNDSSKDVILNEVKDPSPISNHRSPILIDYTDSAQISPWAMDAMGWAVNTGLISGRGNGLLAPKESITRAEAAALIQRVRAY